MGTRRKKRRKFNLYRIHYESWCRSIGCLAKRPSLSLINSWNRNRLRRSLIEWCSNRQGVTWQKLRAALTPVLIGASTVFGFFPALNIVTDEFIDLIRERRINSTVRGFEELAYRMGLESKASIFTITMSFLNVFRVLRQIINN